jgi:O-methyltransferase
VDTTVVLSAVEALTKVPNVRHIVDVAGGHGLALTSILRANPHLRGTLIDMPNVVEGTRPVLAREGVADRCEVVAGDMLASVPAGGDLYLLCRGGAGVSGMANEGSRRRRLSIAARRCVDRRIGRCPTRALSGSARAG